MNKGYNDTITDEEQPYRKYVNSNILSLIKASTDDDNDEEDGLINYTILCKAVPTSWFQMSQTTNKQKFEMITKTLPQHFLNETFVKKDDKDILEKKCKELNKLNKLQAKANQTQWA
jgi:hypothetical protein